MAVNVAEEALLTRMAMRHDVSRDGVRTVLEALRRGGGRMAQFSHPDFGGMSQWAPGMVMVGDMFNAGLKAKLDALATELAALLREGHGASQARTGAESPGMHEAPSASKRFDTPGGWWPKGLGSPSTSGSQNAMRYAVFPQAQRLAIEDAGVLHLYDTGSHRISGVSQAQSGSSTLAFTSQAGIVNLADLRRVSEASI